MSDTSILLAETPRPGVRLLTLNRPEARNALSDALLAEIGQALAQVRDDEALRVAVITGGERIFAAGADIRQLAERDAVSALTDIRPRLWEAIRRFPKPLIAAVRGAALGGGCELALNADLIVAGEGARFGQPEINLGIIPGAGGTQRLTRAIGPQRAMRLVLTGEAIGAAEALAIGLVAECVRDEAVLARALDLAQALAAKPPLALRLAKELVLAAGDLPLDAALAYERKAFALLLSTANFREGVGAFLDKRAPNFKGR